MLAPPTFFLAPQWPPHFFNSRIATARDVYRDPFFGVSVSKVSGLGLELFVSRLCIIFYEVLQGVPWKRFKKMIVQNLAVQRGQRLSFLCCYGICEMENTICPLPRLKFILNSIINVYVPIKPQRVITATRGLK